MSAAVQPIQHSGAVYGPERREAVAWVAIQGSETFGVPRRPYGPTRSGAATLVPVFDAAAPGLAAGGLLLVEYTDGLHRVWVVGVRTGIAGELGSEYEVPVVDVRRLDGTCMAYDPGALLDVQVDP